MFTFYMDVEREALLFHNLRMRPLGATVALLDWECHAYNPWRPICREHEGVIGERQFYSQVRHGVVEVLQNTTTLREGVERTNEALSYNFRTFNHISPLVFPRLVLGYVMPEKFQTTGFSEGSTTKLASSSDKTTSARYVSSMFETILT